MSDRPGMLLVEDGAGNPIGGGVTVLIAPTASVVNGRLSLPGISEGIDGLPANPTAQVGLTPVNGAATTFMRSDAAPALDQSIAPTWTGQHAFTLGPTAPTAAPGTNTTQLSTTAFVQTAISDLIGGAPSALNALNELAAALGNDPNFATTNAAALGNRLRVDTNAQGLDATQQGNGRTNLGLGTSAVLNVPASGNAASGEVVKGNDTRLTDARTPTAHAASHAAAGSDPLTLAQGQITNLVSDLAAKQPLDATLTALAGVTTAADRLVYATGADAFAVTTFTAFGRSLVDDADAPAGRATLGVVIGTDVQAYDAGLAALAAFNTNGLLVQTADNTFAGRSVAVTPSTGLAVTNGDGVAGNITLAGVNATDTVKGVASFNSTNFSVSSGAVNTVQNINTGASPTFAGATFTGDVLLSAATANLFLKDTSTGFKSAATTVVTLQANNAFRSTSFTSGLVGYDISAAGAAEFADITVRGAIRSSVLLYNAVLATNGSQVVTKAAAKLRADVAVPSSPTYGTTTVTIDVIDQDGLSHANSQLFVVNDVLQLKDGITGSTWFKVASVSDQTTFWRYTASIQAGTNNVTYRAGLGVLDYGQSGAGFIVQTADQTNSPYLQMATHAATFSAATSAGTLNVTPQLRLGNLNGSYGYASDIYGFGTGQYGAASKSWITVDQTNGIRLGNNTTTIGQWDTSGNLTLGEVATDSGNLHWDNSLKQLQFRGETAGTTVLAALVGGMRFAAGDTVAGTVREIAFAQGSPAATAGFCHFGARYGATFREGYFNVDGTTGKSATITVESNSSSGASQPSSVLLKAISTYGSVTLGLNSNSSGVAGYVNKPCTVNDATVPAAGLGLHVVDAVNSTTGFRVANAATAGNVLRGNGTNFISAQLAAADLSNGVTGSGSVVLATAPTLSALTITGALTVDTTSLVVDATNNRVGVGTASPSVRLHVVGTSDSDSRITLDNTNASHKVSFQIEAGVNEALLQATRLDASVVYPSLCFATGAARRVTISNAGLVRFHAYGAGTLTTDASGNITATSDERLKDMLGPFTAGLDALRFIEPIIYKWKVGSGLDTGHAYYGFSAQNVRRVVPGAVGVNEDGTLSLQDRALMAVTVNAVKELDSEMTAQGRRIKELEQEVAVLKKQLGTQR